MTFEEQCEKYNPNYNYEARDWKASRAVREYMKQKEGFRDHWYKDGNGNPTIGYGFTEKYLKEHNLLDMFPPVEKDLPTAYEPAKENQQRIDRESCDGIFESMVDDYSERAKKIDGFNNLDRSQRDALVSYFYNAGFNQPKLKEALASAKYEEVKRQMDAGYNDTKNGGLRIRRDEERSIYDGVYPESVWDYIGPDDAGFAEKNRVLEEAEAQQQQMKGFRGFPQVEEAGYNFFQPQTGIVENNEGVFSPMDLTLFRK